MISAPKEPVRPGRDTVHAEIDRAVMAELASLKILWGPMTISDVIHRLLEIRRLAQKDV